MWLLWEAENSDQVPRPWHGCELDGWQRQNEAAELPGELDEPLASGLANGAWGSARDSEASICPGPGNPFASSALAAAGCHTVG